MLVSSSRFEASQIRLMTIEPGDWDDDITCSLQSTSLDDLHEYEALSYVWGDANVTRSILLDGHSFQATTNLESALRHLRLRAEPRMMWIDAICIDRSNVGERGSQVQQMRQIYQQASRTMIWLGEGSEKKRMVFGFLPRSKY
jgi:S-adenosylmethionine:diacylglycerol 3-amino-3-carboxypropyl transferase